MSWRSAMLWLGLVVAFSPVVVDLLRHCAAEPWAGLALAVIGLCRRFGLASAPASALAGSRS